MIENRERDCVLGLCRNYRYMVVYMYITLMYVDFISSPYLLVFGDDRVRGTREQRMLMQVVPVTLRYGAGDSMGDFYGLCYLYFEINCKSL